MLGFGERPALTPDPSPEAGEGREFLWSRRMGAFRVGCLVENHSDRSKSVRIPKLLVDTGSEYTWIAAVRLEQIGVVREKKDVPFVMANGKVITQSVGFAILRVGRQFTIDEVVFAELGDLSLLGARTLEGLNLMVDAARKKLVAAGPVPAAVVGQK
jgi:predicted aspartyl protease